MKSVVLDGFGVNPGDLSWDWLSEYGEYTVYDRTAPDKVADNIGDADIVFTNRMKIDASVLEKCPNIKFVSALGTGYDMIDTKSCHDKGVVTCNVPGYSTMSVAQLAFTLLLNLTTDVNGFTSLVKDMKWTGMAGVYYQNIRYSELDGKTVGIYGCGSIGMAFAKMCQPFGLRVLATKRSKTSGTEDGITYVTPDELLAQSDYISFHCPLTDETRGMVNAEFISKMKDGARIINTSRGAVLNEQDVADALKSGKLGGAGCDVLAVEPPVKENPLLTAPNTIITPHCAWVTKEARLRLMDILNKNLKSFATTGHGINEV